MKCAPVKAFGLSTCGILLTLTVIMRECQPHPLSGLMLQGLLYFAESESPGDNDISPIPEQGGAEVPPSILCPLGSAYHKETSSCYELLEKGPCGELQLFYPLSRDSQYGNCACKSNPDGCSRTVPNNRLILPGGDSKRCFWAYSQGPCKSDDEWYILNAKTFKPECRKNPCLSKLDKGETDTSSTNTTVLTNLVKEETDVFTFVKKGVCFQTFTKAYCPQGQYVQFLGTNDPNPQCLRITSGPPMCLLGVAPVVGMPCDPGFKLVGEECVMANVEFE